MEETFDLEHFVRAQDLVYDSVVKELQAGQKVGHWMWFIFPQIAGLGVSATSERFAISGREEAIAYLEHPVLGKRLKDCTELVLSIQGRTAAQIFHNVDSLKFRSSMTLFAQVSSDPRPFQKALSKYYEGLPDCRTLRILDR